MDYAMAGGPTLIYYDVGVKRYQPDKRPVYVRQKSFSGVCRCHSCM